MANTSKEDRVITALFHSREDAENAYEALTDRGFSDDQISIVMSEETHGRHYEGEETEGDKVKTEMGNKAAEGAGVGSAIGGTAGGIAGAIAAAAAPVVFPGVGIVLSGPLAAALTGAGAGGLTGGLIGGLVGAGIPEERAKHYKGGLEEGGILIGAHPRTEAQANEVEEVFRKYHGEHVYQ